MKTADFAQHIVGLSPSELLHIKQQMQQGDGSIHCPQQMQLLDQALHQQKQRQQQSHSRH